VSGRKIRRNFFAKNNSVPTIFRTLSQRLPAFVRKFQAKWSKTLFAFPEELPVVEIFIIKINFCFLSFERKEFRNFELIFSAGLSELRSLRPFEWFAQKWRV